MKAISKLKDDARRHEHQEEWEKAVQVYLEVLRVGEDGEGELELPLYNRVGDLYVRLGRPDDAVRYYEQAADRYAEAGLYNNAIALCNKALRYHPDHLDLLRKLGQFSASQGFLIDARRYFLEFAEKQFSTGSVDEALGALEDFADVADDPEIRELLGRRLHAHGRTAEAVAALGRAHILFTQAGDLDRAAAVLAELQAIDPAAAAATGAATQEAIDSGTGPEPQRRPDTGPPHLADFEFEEPPAHESATSADTLEGLETTQLAGPVEDAGPAPLAADADALEITGFDDAGESTDVDIVEGLESTSLDFGAAAAEYGAIDLGLDVERDEGVFDLPVDASSDLTETGPGDPFADTMGIETEGLELPEFAADDDEGDIGFELPLLHVEDDDDDDATGLVLPGLGRSDEEEGFLLPTADEAEGEDDVAFDLPVLEGESSFELPLLEEPGGDAEPSFGTAGFELAGWDDVADDDDAPPPVLPPPESTDASAGRELTAAEELAALIDDALMGAAYADDWEQEFPSSEEIEAGDPAAGEPVAGEPVADEPVADEPVADEPVADEPVADEPVAEEPVAGEPVADEPYAGEPVIEEPVAEDPDSEEIAVAETEAEVSAEFPEDAEPAGTSGFEIVDVQAELAEAAAAEEELEAGWTPADLPEAAAAEREPEAAPVAPAAPTGDEDGFVDLGALLAEDEPETTRFRVQETAPTGDEDRDFAELLSQFKAKVSEHLPPEDAAAHYDLGLAFKEMGLIDEAISEFQIALRAGHMRLQVYEELGDCFLQKDQFNIAEKVLRRGLETKHDDELELLGVYYFLGRAYEGMGRFEQARDAYERVLGMDINFQDVSVRLSRL
jgi:tetratricopeptide (TPR) repeat protein